MRNAIEPCVAWVVGGEARIGFGVAEERTASSLSEAVALAAELSSSADVWFGGLAFPAGRSWPGFPAARFVRPERVERRRLAPARGDAAVDEVIGAMSEPWRAVVQRAVSTRGLEKVVLARSVTVDVAATPWDIFEALCALPAARHFFIRSGASVFMGATPETLVRWRDGIVEIDALAGSARPGVDFGEKEYREHDFVVRDVLRALEGLDVQRPAEPSVMELPYVRHLHTPVRARTSDLGPLLARLFPTSAVAGAPRERALEFIAEHEGLDRGWYSGAVGCIGLGEADLAVALRCLLVEQGRARLFAGAGIVAGSDPQAEWEETARKMLPARRAISRAQANVAADRLLEPASTSLSVNGGAA